MRRNIRDKCQAFCSMAKVVLPGALLIFTLWAAFRSAYKTELSNYGENDIDPYMPLVFDVFFFVSFSYLSGRVRGWMLNVEKTQQVVDNGLIDNSSDMNLRAELLLDAVKKLHLEVVKKKNDENRRDENLSEIKVVPNK